MCLIVFTLKEKQISNDLKKEVKSYRFQIKTCLRAQFSPVGVQQIVSGSNYQVFFSTFLWCFFKKEIYVNNLNIHIRPY